MVGSSMNANIERLMTEKTAHMDGSLAAIITEAKTAAFIERAPPMAPPASREAEEL